MLYTFEYFVNKNTINTDTHIHFIIHIKEYCLVTPEKHTYTNTHTHTYV